MQSVQANSSLQNLAPEPSTKLLSSPTAKLLLNGLLFQLGWFACVLGGDGWALLSTAIILALHQKYLVSNRREWLAIAAVTAIGFGVDNSLAYFDVFQFQTARLINIPIWLLCIWALFASSLLHSLAWLRHRLIWSVLLAAVAGPASYLAGSKMASVTLLEPVFLSLWPIAVCWAVLMPLLLRLSSRLVDEI